jgi:hypothetical protein
VFAGFGRIRSDLGSDPVGGYVGLFEVARVGREGVTSVLDLRCPGTGPGFENLRFGESATGQKGSSFVTPGLVFARASFAAAVIAVFLLLYRPL